MHLTTGRRVLVRVLLIFFWVAVLGSFEGLLGEGPR